MSVKKATPALLHPSVKIPLVHITVAVQMVTRNQRAPNLRVRSAWVSRQVKRSGERNGKERKRREETLKLKKYSSNSSIGGRYSRSS